VPGALRAATQRVPHRPPQGKNGDPAAAAAAVVVPPTAAAAGSQVCTPAKAASDTVELFDANGTRQILMRRPLTPSNTIVARAGGNTPMERRPS
jgi:hypothetical protein